MENETSYLGVSFPDVVRGIIDGKWIVQHGIIQQIIKNNIVIVTPSVVAKANDYMAVTCVLCSFGGSSGVIDIAPKIHDKVLLFSPKTYDSDMFDNAKGETKVNGECQGYNPFTCIAVPVAQLGSENCKNRITLDEGKVKAMLGYNATDDYFNFDFTLNTDGSVSIKQGYDKDNNKYHVNVSTGADGSFSIANDKATISVSADGNINIETSGKYTFKSGSLTLESILEDFANEVKQLITTGSPATQQTSPATQQKIDLWVTNKLKGLLS